MRHAWSENLKKRDHVEDVGVNGDNIRMRSVGECGLDSTGLG